MDWRKLAQKYGLMFSISYGGAFFFLVTFYERFKFNTFPGDILIGKSFYLPFTSSLAIAAFVVIIIELFKAFR